MEKRYKQTGYYYAKYYSVECPKCHKEATVSHDGSYWGWKNAELKCLHCMHKENRADLLLYEVTVRRNCPDCGKQISAEINNLKNPPKEMNVTCPDCSFSAKYTTNISSYRLVNKLNGMKGDPLFNYPLWLQGEVKRNLFWAYNREHLEEIRSYVDAELRERQSLYLMTMVARLPQFIKEAKNRDDILKKIDILLKR
ncbi:hypothetical protein [Dysgonomonas macrotermitis]|nr:hypothetical protein [Dysgonomonas macrotermitis]